MRHPGNALLAIGVLVGVVSGVWIGIGATAGSLPWLIGVGLIKLTFVASLGLLAGGAVALRVANRAEARSLADTHRSPLTRGNNDEASGP